MKKKESHSAPAVPAAPVVSPAVEQRKMEILSEIPPVAGEDTEVSSTLLRAVAFAIDNVAISLAFQCAQFVFVGSLEWALMPFAVLFNVLYDTAFLTTCHGQTPGKMAVGIRVVYDDGTPITLSSAFWIALLKFTNLFLFADGVCVVLNPFGQRKAIHNFFTETVVVKPAKKIQ